MEDIVQFHTNPGPSLSVCRCAIITMTAGPTIHIIHNFFLTLTKQNKMLSIVSVDHGNNIIV